MDTFHEVKRKRDQRKENYRDLIARRRPAIPGRRGRRGSGNYPSRHILNDTVGRRNPSSEKENGIYQATDKGNASSSPTNSEMTCSEARHSIVPAKLEHTFSPESRITQVSGSSGIVSTGETSASESNKAEFTSLISVDIKDGSASQLSALSVGQLSSVASKSNNKISSQLLPSSSVIGSSRGRPPSNYGSRSQQVTGPQKAIDRSLLTSKSDKKIKDLQFSEIKRVIIPHHLQVPEPERLGLNFGSFDATFELGTSPTIEDTATSKSEFSQDIEENVEVLSLSIRNESPTVKEANVPDHPQISTSIPENKTHSASSYPALLLPQVRTGQFPPFESNESQSREATRFPSTVPIKEAAAHGNILANNMDRLTMSCFYLLLARVALQGSISSDMVDPLYYQFLEFKKEEKRKMMVDPLYNDFIYFKEEQERKERIHKSILECLKDMEQKAKEEQEEEEEEEESSVTEESDFGDDHNGMAAGPPYQACDFEPDEYWF